MTAPQQPVAPVPVQDPATQQVPVPVPEQPAAPAADSNSPWPPDEQTLLQLQMDARFSILDEPAGSDSEDADLGAQPAGATTPAPAATEPVPVPPAKE